MVTRWGGWGGGNEGIRGRKEVYLAKDSTRKVGYCTFLHDLLL